jgi:hypothetical protein
VLDRCCRGCGAPLAATRRNCAYCQLPTSARLRWSRTGETARIDDDQGLLAIAAPCPEGWGLSFRGQSSPAGRIDTTGDPGQLTIEDGQGTVVGILEPGDRQSEELVVLTSPSGEPILGLRGGGPTGLRVVDRDGNPVALFSEREPSGPREAREAPGFGERKDEFEEMDVLFLEATEAVPLLEVLSLLLY